MTEITPSESEKPRESLFTLRVRGGKEDCEGSRPPTNPFKLARSILRVLSDNKFVDLESVGPIAERIVMAAYRIAREEAVKLSCRETLVLQQTEYFTIIAGKRTRGVRTHIFILDVKHTV